MPIHDIDFYYVLIRRDSANDFHKSFLKMKLKDEFSLGGSNRMDFYMISRRSPIFRMIHIQNVQGS